MYDNEERFAMGLSIFQMSLVQADKCRSWIHVCADELALVHGL